MTIRGFISSLEYAWFYWDKQKDREDVYETINDMLKFYGFDNSDRERLMRHIRSLNDGELRDLVERLKLESMKIYGDLKHYLTEYA